MVTLAAPRLTLGGSWRDRAWTLVLGGPKRVDHIPLAGVARDDVDGAQAAAVVVLDHEVIWEPVVAGKAWRATAVAGCAGCEASGLPAPMFEVVAEVLVIIEEGMEQ